MGIKLQKILVLYYISVNDAHLTKLDGHRIKLDGRHLSEYNVILFEMVEWRHT